MRTRSYKRMMSRRSLVAGAFGSVAAAGAVAIPARCFGKIYPGTAFRGFGISGLTPETGEVVLRASLATFNDHALTFVFEDQTWKPGLSDLGIMVDYDSMLEQAMTSGREGGPISRYSAFLGYAEETDISLVLREDAETLNAYLEMVAEQIKVKPENARLERQEKEIEILPHIIGRSLKVDSTKEQTLREVRSGRTATIYLQTEDVPPEITSSDLVDVREEAYRLISEPIVLSHNDQSYPFETEHLTPALTIGSENRVALDAEKLQGRIGQIAQHIFKPAQDVKLGWDGGLYVVEDDVGGVELDRDAVVEAVQELARSDSRSGQLPVKPVRARARGDNLDTLGIESHLGSGSSSFAGSSAARSANVAVSADNINYKLVGPGEEFSFNDLLGPITEDHGYIAGTVIQGNWVESDIGGGVCQVSTTVFRAAVNAGIQFAEWNPHSWRLAFYEEDGSPPGLDAVIYQPNTEYEDEQDLRFENPFDSWLLLMMVIDGDTLSAHLYGKGDGRSVELFPARISDPIPVGDPVERVNASLAPGERRKVQGAEPGYTVSIRRRIIDAHENVVSDGDFVSYYVPQPEAWEVGLA